MLRATYVVVFKHIMSTFMSNYKNCAFRLQCFILLEILFNYGGKDDDILAM